jgi:hypothetical protein
MRGHDPKIRRKKPRPPAKTPDSRQLRFCLGVGADGLGSFSTEMPSANSSTAESVVNVGLRWALTVAAARTHAPRREKQTDDARAPVLSRVRPWRVEVAVLRQIAFSNLLLTHRGSMIEGRVEVTSSFPLLRPRQATFSLHLSSHEGPPRCQRPCCSCARRFNQEVSVRVSVGHVTSGRFEYGLVEISHCP